MANEYPPTLVLADGSLQVVSPRIAALVDLLVANAHEIDAVAVGAVELRFAHGQTKPTLALTTLLTRQ